MIERLVHNIAVRALRRQWCGTRIMLNAKEAYEFALRASKDSTLRENLDARERYERRLYLDAHS